MSTVNVEATEPDPAATSISNDKAANAEGGDVSAHTDISAVKAEHEQEKSSETELQKSEQDDVKEGKNGEATPQKNGHATDDTPKKREYRKYDRGGDYRPRRRNESKYDPSVLSESDDPALIRGQVEFYFGDSNLPTDANLWERTDGTSNKPVDLAHIHSFKRMQRFQPYEKVVAALRESNFLDVVGEEGKEAVKRKVPYAPVDKRVYQIEKRSIYAKGFGDEEPSTQFDIEAFFAPYGPLNAVRLRRTQDGYFKGSVFVEFHDEQTQEAFLAVDPKPLWKGKHELEITTKAAYCAKKNKEIEDGVTQPKESYGSRNRGGHRGRGRGGNFRGDRRDRDRGDRGDRDPDDWKKRREEDRASGFKDPRGPRRDRDHKGGRGSGRRDDRSSRRDDSNRERENGKSSDRESSPNERKRSHDDTEDIVAPTAKKIDTKSEETKPKAVENDKKRAREEDDVNQETSAKKVDSKSEVSVEAS